MQFSVNKYVFPIRYKMSQKNDIISKLDDIADQALRHGKHVLLPVARLCLISTFIDDGIRMWLQWSAQCKFIDSTWSCGRFIAVVFVLLNLVSQLACCAMVIGRFRVKVACYILFSVIALQTVAYDILWDVKLFLRNVALSGGVLLLLAESQAETTGRNIFAGLPSLGEKSKHKTYMQLSGRVLLIFMFLTLLRFEISFLQLVHNVIGLSLVVLIAVGYKTKLACMVLGVWLSVINFYVNAWWKYSSDKAIHDFLKYDFFQTLSVVGGLLLVVAIGPGGYSMDEHKKKW